MFSKLTSYCVVFLVAGSLVSSACSSSSNPAGPSDTNNPSNSNASGSVRVTVNPNPVPFSGRPIADVAGCEGRNNTWFYTLTLEETGGTEITFHSQIDAFDGFVINDLSGLRISIPAGGRITLSPRWCSSTNAKHTAQHTFTGTDSNGNQVSLQTPTINLMPH